MKLFLVSCCLVSGVEMYRQMLDRAEAGDQIGLLLKGLKKDEVRRGQVVAKPGSVNMHNHYKAQVIKTGLDIIPETSRCMSLIKM